MVGKRKNKGDAWLPPRVYRGKSRYEYRPKSGETIKLCKVGEITDQLKAQVWAEYTKAITAPPQQNDVAKLIEAFHQSPQFQGLGFRTQGDYLHYSARIKRVFGEMLPSDVQPPHIRAFMDKLGSQLNANGKPKTVTANRHHSYLSVLFSWGVERAWLDRNPAKLVRKFKETPRERYITDAEYKHVLHIARASSYPYIAPMMEIAYLCRARSIEVRQLCESDITEEGIFIDRKKGSINEITGWSERLRSAVAEARALFPDAPTVIKRPLFHGRNGAPIPSESFKTAWGRVIRQALNKGLSERFTFHDIKAKGVSDHDKKASGHKTKKMQAVYDRKPGVTAPTK